MKWYKPVKTFEEEVKEPMRQIGIIAITALAVALLALFFALGKD